VSTMSCRDCALSGQSEHELLRFDKVSPRREFRYFPKKFILAVAFRRKCVNECNGDLSTLLV
jgi:hypothetical protein